MITIEKECKNVNESVKGILSAIQDSKLVNEKFLTRNKVDRERIDIISKDVGKDNLEEYTADSTRTTTFGRSYVIYDDELNAIPLEREVTHKIAEQGLSYDDYSSAIEEATERQVFLRRKVNDFLKLSKIATSENTRKRALEKFDEYFEDLMKLDAYIAKLHEYIESERTR